MLMRLPLLAPFLLLAALFAAASCRPKSTGLDGDAGQEEEAVAPADSLQEDTLTEYEEAVEELSQPKKRTEAFSDFMFSFLNNRRFQAERVKFPLTIEAADGSERTITRGRDFRALFQWPNTEEYCVLLTHEEQLEELQNSLELTDVTVQLIELATAGVSDFIFHRDAEEWRCMRVHEHEATGTEGDFLRFYHQFTTDSIFQQQSLAAEIQYSQYDLEEDTDIEGTLEPYQWASFRPELPEGRITNVLFGQQLEGADRILLMHCGTANSMMDIFTFRHHAGKWRLVSFKN